MSNWGESLRAWWAGATPLTRASATGLLLLLAAGIGLAISLAASPDFQPIFHGVSGKDASAIETVLRDHAITMHFDDKEGTISVPSKDESNATMYVEAAGILSKDTDIVGIESLDKIGLGTSSDVERQRILAADEGELARKLMRLDPVDSAAVTISPGSSSSLFGSDVAPSASVILTLKSGETLDSSQVKGIVYLVAHAVTGLDPKNVTLTDQTGVPLWKDNGTGDNSLGDGQPMDVDAKFSEDQRKKLQGLLDMTLGPRKAIVTVNAELDFDQTSTDSVQHTPVLGTKTGLPVSVHEKEEDYSGNNLGASAGASGAASNLNAPTYSSAGNGSGGKYNNTDTTTNYDNDTTHTVVQKAPGSIKKLSVAALVDTSVAAGDITKINAILSTAIGATAGDTTRYVTVQQIAFDNSAQKAETTQRQAAASQQLWGNVARAIAVSVVALALLLIAMRAGRRSEPQLALAGGGANIGLLDIEHDSEMAQMLEERPLTVEDVLAEMPDPDFSPRRQPRRRASAPSIEEHQNLKMESIQDMIQAHPDSVALLIKGWMAEEAKVA